MQVHVHGAAPGYGAAIAKTDGASQARLQLERNRPAIPSDPAHCAYCQEFLVAGAYVAPAPVAVPMPLQFATLALFIVDITSTMQVLSHSWQGRGPPLG